MATPHARSRATAVAAAILALACTARGRGEARIGAGPPGTATILYYDPQMGVDPEDDAAFMVFLPLLEQHGDTLVPRLARAWEHSADWRSWQFHLRTDVRWQDGVPVTAADVKFTYDLLQRPEVDEKAPGSVEATVVDDSTVRITYGSAQGVVPDVFTTFLPRHLLADLDPNHFAEWDFWRNPVGDGAYRVVRLVPNTLIEFEASPDYPLGHPRILHVRFKVGKSAATELLSGAVDAAYPGPADLPVLMRDARFRIFWSDPYNPRVVLWNMKPGRIFADARVRRAVTMALDRRELLRLLDYPPDAPVVDGVLTERALLHPERESAIQFDRAAARQLLAESGWVDHDGDGLLDRGGRPFRFTLACLQDAADRRAAVWLQAQLRLVGIDAKILPLDLGVMMDKARAGALDAQVYYGEAFLRASFARFGELFGTGDPEVQALVDERRWTFDPIRLDSIDHAIAERLREYLPDTYLFPLYGQLAATSRLGGLGPGRKDPVMQMEYLWLNENPPR